MEQIYTIPVHEVFEKTAGEARETGGRPVACHCPLCQLYNQLENRELDMILGAAMMEPSIRMDTNRFGFCDVHFGRMLTYGKRLPLALILQSHLDTVREASPEGGLMAGAAGSGAERRLRAIGESCYLCGRIGEHFGKMVETVALLWQKEPAFRETMAAVPGYCVPHYARLLGAAKSRLGREFGTFYKQISAVENAHLDALREDIDWFCRKFDYRNAEADWNGCQNAPERVIHTLAGDLHRPEEDPKKRRDETLGG